MRRLAQNNKRRALRRKSGSFGFTLVEVMLSLGILSLCLIGFMGLCFATVNMNKQTSLKLMGMKAINYQLNLLNAAAANTGFVELAGNSPQAVIRYFSELRDELNGLGSAAGFPYRIGLDSTHGILNYEFMIPEPGSRNYAWFEDETEMIARQYPLARGVVSVYLKEASVPDAFIGWSDVTASGGSGSPPTIFDMDGISNSADFTDMLDDFSRYSPTKVFRLPISISVRFYASETEMGKDIDPLSAGFVYKSYSEDPERAGHSVVSLVRDCFIGEGGGVTL